LFILFSDFLADRDEWEIADQTNFIVLET